MGSNFGGNNFGIKIFREISYFGSPYRFFLSFPWINFHKGNLTTGLSRKNSQLCLLYSSCGYFCESRHKSQLLVKIIRGQLDADNNGLWCTKPELYALYLTFLKSYDPKSVQKSLLFLHLFGISPFSSFQRSEFEIKENVPEFC